MPIRLSDISEKGIRLSDVPDEGVRLSDITEKKETIGIGLGPLWDEPGDKRTMRERLGYGKVEPYDFPVFSAIKEMIAPTTQQTEKEAIQAYKEIPRVLENVGMRVLTLGGLAGPLMGLKPSELRAALDEDIRDSAGFAPALAPALGETTLLAVEWGYLYPKLFAAVGATGSQIAKIPKVAKGTKALKSLGGIEKVAAKYPRTFNAASKGLTAFTKGAAVGTIMATPEAIGEELPAGEALKHISKRAALLGGVSAGFQLASTADTAIYAKRLRNALIKASNQRFSAKIGEIKAAIPKGLRQATAFKSLESLKRIELQNIDGIVSAAEAQLIGLKSGKMYQRGQEMVETPQKAAERFIRMGYLSTHPYPKGEPSLKKGLGKAEPFIKMPTSRVGEAKEAIVEAMKVARHPVRATERIAARTPPKVIAPAIPKEVIPPPMKVEDQRFDKDIAEMDAELAEIQGQTMAETPSTRGVPAPGEAVAGRKAEIPPVSEPEAVEVAPEAKPAKMPEKVENLHNAPARTKGFEVARDAEVKRYLKDLRIAAKDKNLLQAITEKERKEAEIQIIKAVDKAEDLYFQGDFASAIAESEKALFWIHERAVIQHAPDYLRDIETPAKSVEELQAEIDRYLKAQKNPPTELLVQFNAATSKQKEIKAEPTKPKTLQKMSDSDLLEKRRAITAIEQKRRMPQQIKELQIIEDELFARHKPEETDISQKTRTKQINETVESIKREDLYRDAEQALSERYQALPLKKYSIARNRADIPGEVTDYIGASGEKGYKGYLWNYLTTIEESPSAMGYDEALEAIGGRPGDIGEFMASLDEVVQQQKGVEGIVNQTALDQAIATGEPYIELLAMKYEMLKEGFTAHDINDTIKEWAQDNDVDVEVIEKDYVPVEGKQDVRTKQEILQELEGKSRKVKKRKTAPEEAAILKARDLAFKNKIPYYAYERTGEGAGLFSVTKSPPTKGKYTKATPPEPGEISGKVTEEYIPEKVVTFKEPPRPEGPNILMLAEVEKRLDEKAMLSEKRKLRPGARRLAKQFIGKTDLRKMTEEELSKFGQIIGKLPEPTYNNIGQRIPPSIPKTTAITKAGEFEREYAEPTFMRIFHAPEYYAEKLGVKSLIEKAEAGKIRFSLEYQQLSNKVDGWVKQIDKLGGTKLSEKTRAKFRNQPTKAVARFRELLDTHDEAPDSLNPKEKDLFNNFREMTRWLLKRENAVRESLELEPIQYRKAYVRHVAKGMAKEMMAGRYPFPQGRKFWAEEIIAKKIYNTMEMHRTMTEDLEEIFSRDLGFATKSMLWTALKEIHLSQPIRYLEQQLNAKGKDTPIFKTLSPSEQAKWDKVATIPSRTRRWAKDYVNVTIKGQQSRLDQDIEAIVKKTGLNGLLNKALAPFGRALSHKPVSNFVTEAGRAQIMGVLGGPIGGRPRQIMRNKFQTLQSMALYPLYKETWRTYAPIRALRKTTPDLERLLDKSLFLKAYTGTEEWPVDIKNKIAKASLRAYQWSATSNARQAMETAYWGMLPLFNKPKFKHYGWADPQRTYKEKPEFLYPSEEKLMLKEMEFGAAATQHNYTPIGMPEIFRHKTLTPITRLQSWWMNHYFRFTEEAMRRAFTGKPTYSKEGGPILPWKYRLGWLRYALIAVPILNMMRYQRSYFFGAAPTGVPPFAQFAQGMYNYVVGKGAANDQQWKRGKKQMIDSGKTFIPGYMSYKDFEAIWSGKKDLGSLFFYKKRQKKKEKSTWVD